MPQLTQAQRNSETYKIVYDAVQFREGAKEAIEAILDKFDLQRFLEWTSEVCDAKACHVAENWQDDKLAMQWRHASNRLDTVSQCVPVLRASGK